MRARGSLGNGRDPRLDSGRATGGEGNLRGKDVRMTRAGQSEAKSLAITDIDKVGDPGMRMPQLLSMTL